MSDVSKGRVLELDILKIMAILLVIISHLQFFTILKIPQVVSDYAAFLGVGMFFFVSGYTLRLSYGHIGSWSELKRYYARRFLRIFPPYWVVLLIYVLFIAWVKIDDLSMLVYVFGLQELYYWYYPFIISPLWFVGGILIFYVVFSLLAVATRTWKGLLLLATGIFVAYFLLRCVYYATYVMDPYMFVWYFVFIAGVVSNDLLPLGKTLRPQARAVVLAALVSLFALSMLAYTYEIEGHLSMIANASTILLTVLLIDAFCLSFSLFFLISLRGTASLIPKQLARLAIALAFSSYGVYLIHGIILESVSSIWSEFALGSSLDPYAIIGDYSAGDLVHDMVIMIGAVALSFLAGYVLLWHMARIRERLGSWRRRAQTSTRVEVERISSTSTSEASPVESMIVKTERREGT